ncbi:MAG: pirin family protein [bacterium]
MKAIRTVKKIFSSVPTLEGAGVHLKRGFGYHQVPELDPFLLLDDFHSSNPADYVAGFPWHPHRGIETISYILKGFVEHGDSMGNKGVIGEGDVQWMTAGSGIIHQEMPKGMKDGRLWGFQLWANLPASHKMMAPRYQEIKAPRIPEVCLADGVNVKVICGTVNEVQGPVRDIVTDPEYLDVAMPASSVFKHTVKTGHTVFAYVIEGHACFSDGKADIGVETVVLFGDGDSLKITAGSEGARFLLVSGRPLGEPVAWYGPIVMNTEKELEIARRELSDGTFLKG